MIKKTDMDKIDKSGMYKIYDSWPELAEESYNRIGKKNNFGKPPLEVLWQTFDL